MPGTASSSSTEGTHRASCGSRGSFAPSPARSREGSRAVPAVAVLRYWPRGRSSCCPGCACTRRRRCGPVLGDDDLLAVGERSREVDQREVGLPRGPARARRRRPRSACPAPAGRDPAGARRRRRPPPPARPVARSRPRPEAAAGGVAPPWSSLRPGQTVPRAGSARASLRRRRSSRRRWRRNSGIGSSVPEKSSRVGDAGVTKA